MDRTRVVEIWNPVLGESGSGYLVGDDVVLTSRHVVGGVPARGRVDVRRLDAHGRAEWAAAELVWHPDVEGPDVHEETNVPEQVNVPEEADGALLRITEPDWQPPVSPPVRFGRVVGQDRVPCLGLGFPDAAVRPDKVRDTMPIRGHVDPLHGIKSAMTTVHVDVGIVPDRARWRGSSGAALFCGAHLVAVVTTVKRLAPGVLGAVPLGLLAEHPGFARTLRAHGVHDVVEDVDGAPPDPAAGPGPLAIAVPRPSVRDRAGRTLASTAGGAVVGLGLLVLALPAPGVAWPLVSVLAGVLTAWAVHGLTAPRAKGTDREAVARQLGEAVREEMARRRWQLLGNDHKAINITYVTVPQGGRDADRAWGRGDFENIGRYLTGLRPQRLVVTGGPGSGKTLLAYELVRHVLAHTHGDGPVPVPVGLSEWDTGITFADWFCARLTQEYLGRFDNTARDLLASGRILPVLDGLDEMDPPGGERPRAVAALAQLNRYAGPLVLTCRTDEYATLSGDGRRLLDCATVRIEAVRPVDGRRYLAERSLDRTRLTGVHDSLLAEGTVTREVLSSPWMLTLASLASRTKAGTAKLHSFVGTPVSGARTAEELRAALLEEFVPSLCAPDPVDRRPPPYPAHDVVRWLRLLATGLRGGSAAEAGHAGPVPSRDLAVHTLWPIAGPRRARYAAAAITLICWLPALLLLTVCLHRDHALPLPGAVLLGLLTPAPLLSAWHARARYVQPRRILFQRLRSRLGWSRITLGGALGSVLMLPLVPLFGRGFALAAGTAFAVVYGFGLALSVRADLDRRVLLAVGAPVALVVTVAAGFLAGGLGDFIGLTAGCGAGAISLLLGVTASLRAARRDNRGEPDPDPPGVPTPLSPLRNDVKAGVVSGVLVAALALYATLDVDWLRVPRPLAAVTAVACGVAAGPGFVSVTGRQYLGLLVAVHGRLPWRLTAFLRWCHGRGLLRSAGTVYRIRHDELLEWLQR